MKILSTVFQNKKQKQNMKRLSFITQFKMEFLLPFTGCRKVLGKMSDLVMELQWIQVSFECCDSIQTPYTDKTCWYVHGRIDVLDVGTSLGKKNWGWDPMWGGCNCRCQSWYGWYWPMSNIDLEVSERKDHMVAQIIERYIIGTKQTFY